MLPRFVHIGLGAVLAVLVAAVPLNRSFSRNDSAPPTEGAESEFARLVNDERVSRGLGPLSHSEDLVEFGREHSATMRDSDHLHHSDLDRIPNARRVSENVGHGVEIETIHEAFMESEPHRRNVLLAEFVQLGVGVAADGDELWVTLYFRIPHRGPPAPPVAVAGAAPGDGESGYRLVTEGGKVMAFGDASYHGSPPDGTDGSSWSGPAADLASQPGAGGYWVLDEDGRVAALGGVAHHGSLDEVRARHGDMPRVDAVGIAPTPSGDGYWILDEAGGVFTFGDASFHGSMPQLRDTREDVASTPAVDIVATRSGDGYWILDEAGGVFTFGDAAFHGSVHSGDGDDGDGDGDGDGDADGRGDWGPAVGMAAVPGGDGYWILDQHGVIAAFGAAPLESADDAVGDGAARALVPASDDGAWVITLDGRVIDLGTARYEGSVR